MKVRVILTTGNVLEIPNVKWHPEAEVSLGIEGTRIIPAGCYVRKSAILKRVNAHNEYCDEISEPELKWEVNKIIEDLECAEMPFDILDDESEIPWKNSGNCLKEVKYGRDENFWNNHA